MADGYARVGRNEYEDGYLREKGDGVVLETEEEEELAPRIGSPSCRRLRAQQNVVYLYLSHFFGTFGNRMWQFAVPYLFSQLWPSNMVPQSIFCLLLYSGTFFGMFTVGNWMDHRHRLEVIRTSIVLEAVSICCAILFFWLLLEVGKTGAADLQVSWGVGVSFTLLVAASISAELMTRAGTIALEKDWVVVIADGDQLYQTHLNAWMRRIDLTCKLGGPLLFVVIDTMFRSGTTYSAFYCGIVVVFLWNVLSVPLELMMTQRVWDAFPELDQKKEAGEPRKSPVAALLGGTEQYMGHEVRWASLGYTQLWCTVLDNGHLMTAFLVWAGVSDFVNVGSRGLGAAFGILGTFFFPVLLERSSSLESAGRKSILVFAGLIAAAGTSFLFLPTTTAAYVLCVVVVLSRAPLWSFDLAIQQILQERVEEEHRGTINGVHSALCQLQMMFVYVLALIMAHDYSQFKYLVFLSVVSVFAATYMYEKWIN